MPSGCVVGGPPSDCDGVVDSVCGDPPVFAASANPFWNCSGRVFGWRPDAVGLVAGVGVLGDVEDSDVPESPVREELLGPPPPPVEGALGVPPPPIGTGAGDGATAGRGSAVGGVGVTSRVGATGSGVPRSVWTGCGVGVEDASAVGATGSELPRSRGAPVLGGVLTGFWKKLLLGVSFEGAPGSEDPRSVGSPSPGTLDGCSGTFPSAPGVWDGTCNCCARDFAASAT